MKSLVITTKITKRESESFKQYLKEIAEIEPFATPKDEYECAMKAFNGDAKATEELISRNLRFVISCAKQYMIGDVKLEDLVNVGNIGITSAAKRFDPTLGFKFISYAVWYIRKEIISYLTSSSRFIRIPSNKVNEMAKYTEKLTKLEQELERHVDESDMLDAYPEYTKEDIEMLSDLTHNGNVTSLDICVGQDEGSSFSELIPDTTFGNADDLVMKADMEININALTSILTPREKQILTMLFGLDGQGPSTLSDVGQVLDISREAVRQNKDKALRKIKNKFKGSLDGLLCN